MRSTKMWASNLTLASHEAGKGKCSVLDEKEATVTVGKEKCSYMYSYGDKDWTKYKYSAFCHFAGK